MKASSKEPCMSTVVLLILCALCVCVCVCLICCLRSSRPSSLSISIATLKEPARMETSTKPWRTKTGCAEWLCFQADKKNGKQLDRPGSVATNEAVVVANMLLSMHHHSARATPENSCLNVSLTNFAVLIKCWLCSLWTLKHCHSKVRSSSTKKECKHAWSTSNQGCRPRRSDSNATTSTPAAAGNTTGDANIAGMADLIFAYFCSISDMSHETEIRAREWTCQNWSWLIE